MATDFFIHGPPFLPPGISLSLSVLPAAASMMEAIPEDGFAHGLYYLRPPCNHGAIIISLSHSHWTAELILAV